MHYRNYPGQSIKSISVNEWKFFFWWRCIGWSWGYAAFSFICNIFPWGAFQTENLNVVNTLSLSLSPHIWWRNIFGRFWFQWKPKEKLCPFDFVFMELTKMRRPKSHSRSLLRSKTCLPNCIDKMGTEPIDDKKIVDSITVYAARQNIHTHTIYQ